MILVQITQIVKVLSDLSGIIQGLMSSKADAKEIEFLRKMLDQQQLLISSLIKRVETLEEKNAS